MIWNMIEMVAILSECFMVTYFIIKYFNYRYEKLKILKTIILFVFLSLSDFIGTFCIVSEKILLIGFCAIEMIFSIIFLKGNVLEKVVVSIMSYIIFYFVNLPVLTITSLLTKVSADMITDVTYQSIIRVIGIFITKLLYFIFIQIILIIRKKETFNFKLNEWIIVTSAFFVTLTIGFVMYTLVIDNKFKMYIYVLIALLLSALDIIIFAFIKKINTAAKKDIERQLLKFQLMQQENDIQQLEHQYNDFAVLRHDYKNQLNCLYSLIRENKYAAAENYIQEFIGNSSVFSKQHIQSSSSVFNAVINEKFSCAEQKDIETSCRILVQVPHYLEYDLSIALSNLLDNAIEACEKNDIHSEIITTITETAGYYRVIVKNTIEKSILKENNNLQSSKENKFKHGWGLKSVYKIVEKHNGIIGIYEKENLFIVSLMLLKNENINMGD